jgi:hypothetical protein
MRETFRAGKNMAKAGMFGKQVILILESLLKIKDKD